MISRLKQLDWPLISASILLVSFGLVSIYSSSMGRGDFSNFNKQIIFFIAGIILMFFFSFFNWKIFKENSYLILAVYFLCLVSLMGLFFFAPTIRGVKTWYKIGGLSIDPTEFMKIILIILLAKYFSKRHAEMYRVRHILLSGFYVFLPSIFIFFQPNMGSVLLIIFLWVGILIVSGIKLKHFLILTLCALVILSLCWAFLLKDYQKARILGFISPQTELLGKNWNQNQAKIAIGSGNIFGTGIGKGSQTQYGFLPEPQTDFIFAAIAEETGIAGVFVILALFSVLFSRIFNIALSGRNNFIRFFATGFAILIISQVLMNIGMNLGLLPVVGISLPLVSYGGSGLLTTFIGLGILQNMKSSS